MSGKLQAAAVFTSCTQLTEGCVSPKVRLSTLQGELNPYTAIF
jgi:hypothetical protein